MRQGIRTLLESMFETVAMVANAKSLIDVVSTLKPDLTIVDLMLPVNDEVDLICELNTREPDTKILVISLHGEPVVVADVMAKGALGFVLKRSVATDLIPAVRQVLQCRRYVSPTVETQSGPPLPDSSDPL